MNLARLQALSADADLANGAVDQGADALKVGIPATLGQIVSM
jgi:hypothetical protein